MAGTWAKAAILVAGLAWAPAAAAGSAAYDLNVFFGADPFAQQFWNQVPGGLAAVPPLAPVLVPARPAAAGPVPAAAAPARQDAQVQLEPGLRPIPPVVPAAAAVPVEVPTEQTREGARFGNGRWYLMGSLGIASFSTAANKGTGVDHTVDFDSGTLVHGALGYEWRPNWNLEAEIAYRQASASTATPAGDSAVTAAGDRMAWSVMANALYAIDVGWPLTPYLLGGAGFAVINVNNIDAAGITAVDSSESAFAYQFGIGADFPLSERWSADTSYRYFATTNPELKNADGRTFETEVAAHNFQVGARVRF